MNKLIFKGAVIILGLIYGLTISAQKLLSPDYFLGYPLGNRYTPHHQIVAYCKYIANAKPNMVHIEQYGETNEHKPLLVAFISSPENILEIDNIRVNNLRIAGVIKDKSAPITKDAPAIVWLSYNVHGNEPASSEAAMKTLYELVNSENIATKEWLKHTVVIIDPCLNPDGRDRYVNWFNSMVGDTYNVNALSREHVEPWPSGRSNHYYFDLNRDWAWQTQIETQSRMRLYKNWMPQVHVDYHEQGFNQPYYFAPASEPFHELITPWQRSFQTSIGKHHAQYFDEKSWLYFTKQEFDLFYPSYGDTYPMYNGAIGMTYEQGGIRAGLGVQTDNGDTLLLSERILHHYITGISTIEMASKNAQQLVDSFKQFFDDNRSGKKFTYKTYLLTSDNKEKLAAVENLLQKNGIVCGQLTNKKEVFKGFHYSTQLEETGQLKQFHLAINVEQTNSLLATVLLEPKGKLSDSNTYDITAWSIPYAYGVDAFAVKESLKVTVGNNEPIVTSIPQSQYGYLIPYSSFNGTKVLARLLKQGIKVRMATKPFDYNKQHFERGTLIVLSKGNSTELTKKLADALDKTGIEAFAVASGYMEKGADFGSSDIHFLTAPKVAMLAGEQSYSLSVGEVWNLFDKVLQYPISLLNVSDLSRLYIKDFNTLIIPDGNYKTINDKAVTEKLKEFVSNGGKIIALENAVQQIASGEWGIKLKEEKKEDKEDKDKKDDYSLLKKYGDKERTELSNAIPGAIYKMSLDYTHPLAYGYSEDYFGLKQNENIYQFLGKEGWNVGVIKKEGYVTGFSGAKVKAKLKDGLVYGVQEIGNGNIVYFGENPLFRLFWENGKMLFGNAVFLVGQ